LLAANRSLLTLRDGFSGMLAHELRTPLTVILGGLRILRRRLGDGDDEVAQLTADMADEAEHLHRLVEDLLVVSRGDGAIHVMPEPVLVQRVLARATDQARRAHPALAIVIEGDADPPPVMGDALLLEQVFANLFSNAAKYAGESAHVTVRLERSGAGLLIRVTDDGRGFPPGSGHRVFAPFYRAPDTVLQASGAGVGLYVVKRLVEAMGGSVEAANAADGGASVTVSLPLTALDEDPDVRTAPPPVGATTPQPLA
jgi:signal transduction histidine kinase